MYPVRSPLLADLLWLPATALVLSSMLIFGQAQTQPRNLTVDDLFAIRRVGDPRVSPDGQWISYTVSETDLEEDKSETAVWMMPAEGGEAIRMTAAGYSADRPRWSPDGKYLSFQASRGEDAKTQVWVLNRLGGEARQLTDVKQGIGSYEWSPDSKRLVLVVQDPEPEEEAAGEEKKGAEKKEEKPKPHVIDRLQFKRDYAGYLDRRRDHLYVFDLESRDLRQITSGDYDDSQPAWSPDGKSVAFVSNRTREPDANDNTDIWIVSADNPDQGKTLLQVTTNPGADSQPAWSPDGKQIAYVTVVRPEIIWYATRHLAIAPSSGGDEEVLTASLDRHVSDPGFAADGSIYFVLEDSAERHLARMGPDGELQRLVADRLEVRSFHLGPEDMVASLVSRPAIPGEIFGLKDGELVRLSHVNDELMSRLQLATVENVHFPSRDGTEIEGFIFKPPDFDEKFRYPTLLRIHGGPVAQYDFGFNFEAQLFAANGYVVVLANPRGSSGYGEEFSLGIWQSWGRKDFEDVMAAVDYAVRRGYADPDRLGVGGWSYGGILTNYVITQTDRFAGAVTGASEVLYIANYGHDHYQYEWEQELGLPWENRQLWEKLSPFNSVEKITTPTLIMGGALDWNVPILNSEQLYQALRRLGRTTQLVVYPGEHHGIRRPSFQKDRLQRYLDWYDRYVKGEPKTEADSR